MIGKVGRRKVKINEEAVRDIALRELTTLESLAGCLEMSKSTLHRRFKEGDLIRHSNAVKPALTEKNLRERVQFCLSMIDPRSFGNAPRFIDMYDRVHIDEKWFYITKINQRYYLLSGEVAPKRSCKSKRFITKVMFMVAVARPRVDSVTGEQFSGKIGIFPLVQWVPAKRNSKNRVVGTLELKPIESITKEVTKNCLITQVLPAIRSKWPSFGSRTILIQQDNARPHIAINDKDFVLAAKQDGFDIRLYFQPSNSPDMNVLDLGYFASIQALQQKKRMQKVEDLVAAVEASFDELPIEKLNYVFLTLQTTMVKVLEVLGENHYELPHIGKERLEHLNELPTSISIDESTLKQARMFVNNMR
jgi:hypothetical protein